MYIQKLEKKFSLILTYKRNENFVTNTLQFIKQYINAYSDDETVCKSHELGKI